MADLSGALQVLRIAQPLQGANVSSQYNATIGYQSLVDPAEQFIGIEIGLREPHLTEPIQGTAQTIVQHPFSGQPLVAGRSVRCLSRLEAIAEKLRAALCRREIAIRDFFDVDHLTRHAGLNTADPALLDLVRRKLKIPGTGPVDVSAERMGQLGRQVDAQLRPVLREREFADFDLERAVETVRAVARRMA